MKLLLEHLKRNREALLRYSDVISSANHSVNLGSARESLISNFLKQNLPEFISYHSGEVFDKNNKRSGQIDIVLHPITSPKINLHNAISIFPAEAVLSAIEIKSILTTGNDKGSLIEALESCKKLKELDVSSLDRDSFVVDNRKVPFIIFAFKGPKLKTLKNHLNKMPVTQNLPDLILVLNRGYCLVKNKSWSLVLEKTEEAFNISEDEEEVLIHLFKYILGIVEYWAAHPSRHTIPIDEYTKNMTNHDDLFNW